MDVDTMLDSKMRTAELVPTVPAEISNLVDRLVPIVFDGAMQVKD